MHIRKTIIISSRFLIVLIAANIILADIVAAVGISIDAGLTPAEKRWIFRSQVRFMRRHNDPTPAQREMKSYMFPVVVVYGLRSDLSVMVRQAIKRTEMTMTGQSSSNSGLTDLLVLGKYKLARVNTKTYTFGIAPTLGLELPIGQENFTSNSWDLHMGGLVSGRMGPFGLDLNVVYIWNGMAKTGRADRDLGNELAVESALAYQFGLGPGGNFSLAPVIEFSYQNISADTKDGNPMANTGESVLLLSPGFKVTWSSFILEGLMQFPLSQTLTGQQAERAPSLLVGVRLMN